MKTLTMVVLTVFILAGVVGCTCPPKPVEAAKPVPAQPAPKPAAAPKPAPAPAPKAGACGDFTVSQDFMPTGAIRLEKVMPETVQLNAPFEYTITLTNLTNQMLSNIECKERMPAGLKDVSSAPGGKLENGIVTWKLDSLGPKATDKIVVRATAAESGCLQTCADVTYVVLACASTQVVQPSLAITKTAPANVTMCDPIPLKFVVTNKGTGTAANVRITDTLPEGLTTQDGKASIDLPIGSLAAGQSATRTVVVKAAKTGSYKNQAAATADGGLKAQSEVTTTAVTQPVLAIEKSGPRKEYLGRSIKYDITVTNKGDAPATETVITDVIPGGVTNPQATAGGVLAGNQVTWNVGTLAPKASKTVSVSYMPAQGGTFSNTAKVTAVCAEAVSASLATEVQGIPAVLLEVVDVDDPIAVGNNETYIITVTNQGSAPDTNIVIKCMLEDSMEFVSASGAANGTHADGIVTFAPLQSLAPKAKATWRVVVKAAKPGDVRFTVTMNTSQLGREVRETEATQFYE
jgi:uncharacterized repeat protein (TIGR01451 family)